MSDRLRPKGPAYNIALRLTALLAAIAVFLLRNWVFPTLLGDFLSVLLYAGPYLLIAFCPSRIASIQVGFAFGYAVALFMGLAVLVVLDFDPVPRAARELGWIDAGLVVVAIVTWLWNRRELASSMGGIVVIPALFYPLLAFVLEGLAVEHYDLWMIHRTIWK